MPAGFANMSAVISARLFPNLSYPADFYTKFRGKRVFGDHKTVRALVAGTFTAGVIHLIQLYLVNNYELFSKLVLFDQSQRALWLGFLLGFGAIFGDMIKSFFKRQIGIQPGKPWIPFDQIDWIVGSILIAAPFTQITVMTAVFAAIIGFFLSLSVKFIGYHLKIDTTPI
jgi:CDP-2,3-bis-(O-geranylgeranyl)-sn-glycerol synthase